MHKIERLLQTLAPKGVEFKTLEEVFEIKNGYTPSKNNPEFWKNGTIPWFRMEDIRENGRILKDSIQHITPKALKGKKLFPKNSIIISTTATIGEHALLIVDSLANQRFTFLSKKANCDLALDMKFFFYQCFLLGEWCKKNTNVSGFASVDMTAFKKYKFPIPPLEIQQEIVKILDAFTELNTELNTELKARKKQYEYYQNMLLDFNDINQNHKDAKMSVKTYPKRLKTLLQTLVPKGVEFRKLGEVLEYDQPNQYCVTSKEFDKSYPTPVLTAGKTFILGYTNEKDNIYQASKNAPVIIFDDFTTATQWVDFPFKVKSSAMKILLPKNPTINIRFIFFYMQTIPYNIGGEHARHWISRYSQIEVPIPPLEIQQEIVKILDAFTELNTELNTELKARKKQYEYYQNMLLDFNDINQNHKDAKMSVKTYPKRLKTLLQTLAPKGVEFKTLEEVFEIKNGYTPSKNNPEFWKNGTIPWFRMEDIRENGRILKDSIQHITPKALKGKKLFPKNSIIISTTATIGEHALLIVDSLANQRFTFLSKKANCDLALDMKFFFYQCFLLGEWCKKNTNVSGFASVDMTAFKKYKFPIPPLEIQQEIVKILDAFTELNTELNTELKARKKQYEYYREKLLTFKPLLKQGIT
ncbi:restriction endonuclease subunit S [Helicobacter pylori]|nr:restriction endonuclease subunit S [Helicobacter pylori]